MLSHIKTEITQLVVDRHVYKEVLAIVRANPTLRDLPDDFYAWMRRLYIESMTIRVRRLVDTHWKKPLSFVGLMDEIADHPEVLTRERFVQRYPKNIRLHVADRDFDNYSRPGAAHVTPSIIRNHRRRLMKAQRRLHDFVDKHVAHKDRRPLRRLPTFEELDACVDLLEELLREYIGMIEARALTQVLPVWQYDWKAPFRVPWIPHGPSKDHETMVEDDR